MSTESVMPSNHLILCHPLLLPSIFPSSRVFSDNSKHTNICLIEVSEGEEKNKEEEVKNVFKEIMAKNLPSLRRETDTQVQEA